MKFVESKLDKTGVKSVKQILEKFHDLCLDDFLLFFPVLRFPFLATILNTKLDPVFSLMIRITWKKEKWRKESKWTGLGYSFSCLRVLRITMVVGIEGTYKKGPQFFSFSVFGFAQTMFHLLKNGQVSFFGAIGRD